MSYYGHPYPQHPDHYLRDWPKTGKYFDKMPTWRQYHFVNKLLKAHGLEWAIESLTATQGILGGLIVWLHKGGERPSWADAVIQPQQRGARVLQGPNP